MKVQKFISAIARDPNEEIARLVSRLQEIQQRLQELTGGEIDSVLYPGGQTYLLQNAQEKLRESEANQRQLADTLITIINALPAHIALLDRRGVIISVNNAWQQFASSNMLQGPTFGIDQNYLKICEDVRGDGAEEAHAAADGIRQVLRGEIKKFSIEYPCHSPSEKRWFNLMVTPVREDRLAGAVVMHLDISDRKLAEKQVAEQLELIDMACRVGKLGAWAVEYPSNAVVWSDEVFRIYELEPGVIPDPESAMKHFPTDSRKKLEAALQHIGPYDLELDFVTAKGNKRWVRSTSAIDLKDGKISRRYGTFQDLTERRRTDVRFRRLVNSNVQGVFFWNKSGDIYEANDAFLDIVQYTRDDLKAGRIRWTAMTPKEFLETDQRAMQEVTSKGVCEPYEKEFIRKDGTRVPILLGAAVLDDDPNEGVCFVLNLTERKKLEHQFLRAQRMESVGTLAGGIAHDLNNILSPIMMSIDILSMTATDPESKTILETIKVSARRGADIVRQVLSFARGMQSERVEVQPKYLLKELGSIIRDTFPKNIHQEILLPAVPWTILGDPTQIHQILLNLCVNARDAMPNGGKLTISAENCVLDEQYVAMNSQAKPGRYVLISVTDTGAGVPAEIMEKIFEPFFTTKEVGKGTGLGLSTVMAIVKSHEGLVNIDSEPGKGTTFKVYLPAMEFSSESPKKETQSLPMPRGKGETILLVDDEPAVLTVTSRTLQTFGYQVLTAADGAEAVAIYAQRQDEIAVVITDMMMPILDGTATIRALLRINPAVKIIASSGLNAAGARVPEASIKHFLLKPYTTDALLKTIRNVLEAE